MINRAATAHKQIGEAVPSFQTVVGTGTKLLSAVAELMSALDPSDEAALQRVHGLLSDGLRGVQGRPLADYLEDHRDYLEGLRQGFIEKYDVRILGAFQVGLTLKAGMSRMSLIRDAAYLAQDLLGRHSVYGWHLEKWKKDSAFCTPVADDLTLAIDGYVKNVSRLPRVARASRGVSNVELCDLVTAHQAFLIATGKDLFNTRTVRARDGAVVHFGLALLVREPSAPDKLLPVRKSGNRAVRYIQEPV